MARRKQKTAAAHPGEILRTEFIEPMGITAYQAQPVYSARCSPEKNLYGCGVISAPFGSRPYN